MINTISADTSNMPLIRTESGYQICLGNNEHREGCGKKCGDLCGGCEDFKRKLVAGLRVELSCEAYETSKRQVLQPAILVRDGGFEPSVPRSQGECVPRLR